MAHSLMVIIDFRMDIRVQWKKECYQFCTSAHLLWLTSVAWQAGLYQAWLKPLNTDCLTTTFIYKPCILLYKECLKLCFNEIIISKNNNKYNIKKIKTNIRVFIIKSLIMIIKIQIRKVRECKITSAPILSNIMQLNLLTGHNQYSQYNMTHICQVYQKRCIL